jgi:hypothetical protein
VGSRVHVAPSEDTAAFTRLPPGILSFAPDASPDAVARKTHSLADGTVAVVVVVVVVVAVVALRQTFFLPSVTHLYETFFTMLVAPTVEQLVPDFVGLILACAGIEKATAPKIVIAIVIDHTWLTPNLERTFEFTKAPFQTDNEKLPQG